MEGREGIERVSGEAFWEWVEAGVAMGSQGGP